MRVNLPDYRFYRTPDGYFIQAMSGKQAIYQLYRIVDNYSELLQGSTTVMDAEVDTIPIEEEGSYIIKIRGQSETSSQTKNYYIRHYPTLKGRLIAVAKDIICKCQDEPQDLCRSGQYNNSQEVKHEIYLAVNSIFSYIDVFTSPCFMKYTEHALRIMLGEKIDRFYDAFELAFEYVDEYGMAKSSEELLRQMMSYLFITAYYAEKSTIDFDYVAVGGSQGATDYNDGEQDALDDLFGFAELKQCFYSLGINMTEWMAKFELCFADQPYICTTGVSPFLADSISKYEEFVTVEGTTTIDTGSFSISESSLVMVNGITIASAEYTFSGTVVTFINPLSANDRVTIIK